MPAIAISTLLAVVFLCGCSSEIEQQTLHKLKMPVVVVANDSQLDEGGDLTEKLT